MKNFKGKTAFITGGASGLGLGIAKAFARAGMNIVIADFRQEAIDAALPIFKANSWPVHGVLLDVTDREAYVRAADEAERVFGKIHILVNNAGVGIMEGFIWEASYEDMDFALEINFKSVLNGIKTILPRILAHGEEGWLVSTASKNGLIPLGGMVLYNATKRAVMATMETLAIDLQGTNVGASVFCPGRGTGPPGHPSGRPVHLHPRRVDEGLVGACRRRHPGHPRRGARRAVYEGVQPQRGQRHL